MKKLLFMALVIAGLAACETPQPATGTSGDTSTQGTQGGTGTGTGSGTGSTGTGSGTTTDTTTTKRDSLP